MSSLPSYRTTSRWRRLLVLGIAASALWVTSVSLSSAATTRKVTKKTTKKTAVSAPKTTASAPKTTVTTKAIVPTTTAGSTAPTAPTATTTPSASVPASIVNTWKTSTVDPTKLPIGDSKVTTTGAAVGGLWACRAGNPNAGGASADGPWLNVAAGTWDSTTKLAVQGSVTWPTAKYSETVSGGTRVLTTNNVPVDGQTGTFPIATSDPSYQYDRNPGRIAERPTTVTLTEKPTINASPSCLSEGPIGILKNGVFVFSSLDGRGHDAVAHESQDKCDGHPAMSTYHYHNVPSCVRNAASGSSTVVGWMNDGFPIVVERDTKGALPTNADLDECHGRTSDVLIDGKVINTYHYSATLEFPYFVGCLRGTSTVARNA